MLDELCRRLWRHLFVFQLWLEAKLEDVKAELERLTEAGEDHG